MLSAAEIIKMGCDAETLHPDNIYILSAKYGLLEVDDFVSTYNETLNDKSVRECKEWSRTIIASLKAKCHNLSTAEKGGDKFILLVGKTYYEYLLGNEGIGNYECPYSSCRGIGYILQFLSEKLK